MLYEWIIGNRSASEVNSLPAPSSRSAATSSSIAGFARVAASSTSSRRDGGVLVFVEVKARSGSNFGTPFESITWKKRQRLSQMAASYLFVRRLAGVACRFDVVAVVERQGMQTIELLRGAFDMESLR